MKTLKILKQALILSLVAFLVLLNFYFAFEPGQADAVSDTAVVTLQVTEEISISSPADTSLTPSISGMTGNCGSPSSGSLTWNVKTNNSDGFNMKIHASTDPALQLDASNYFSDYTPESAGVPDYNWNSPSAGEAEFGFTVEPETAEDTVQKFLDDGSACNTGSNQTTDKCWLDFNGTTDIDIINRTTNTDSTGEDEVVKFRAESNGKFLKEGDYTATITVTVSAN